jgi:hypothetical protein
MGTTPHQNFEIGEEAETDAGWAYAVIFFPPGAPPSAHTLSLSWADHERITGGGHRPSATIAGVCAVLAGRPELVAGLRAREDASTLRRRIEGFDDAVRATLGGAA